MTGLGVVWQDWQNIQLLHVFQEPLVVDYKSQNHSRSAFGAPGFGDTMSAYVDLSSVSCLLDFVCFFPSFFNASFVPCRKLGSPFLDEATAAARAVLLLPECAGLWCVQILVWLPVLVILTCMHILMHEVAHGGCMNTVRERAQVDWEKNPLLPGGSSTCNSAVPGFLIWHSAGWAAVQACLSFVQ